MKKILVLAVMSIGVFLCGCSERFSSYVSRQKRYANEESEFIKKYEEAKTAEEKSKYFEEIKTKNEEIIKLNNHYR